MTITLVVLQQLIESERDLVHTSSGVLPLGLDAANYGRNVNDFFVDDDVVTVQIVQLDVAHVYLGLDGKQLATQIFDDASLLPQVCSKIARLKLQVLLLHIRAVKSVVRHHIGALLFGNTILQSSVFISSTVELILQHLI